MVAKLVIALLVLVVITAVLVWQAFRYFERQAELNHEKEMREMDQTEELFEDR
jgi:cell division protein FtsL